MSVFAGRPIIAVVRHHDAATARVIAFAAADVLPAVEVTYTVPGASELIADLIRHDRAVTRETLVGAGTVCDAATARQAIAAGAQFLVAPNFDAAVAVVAEGAGVPYVPGTFSPTEVLAAAQQGCSTVKLFPAATLGPDFLRAMIAVAPYVQFVPTGGIGAADAASWFDAGATAIGIGSSFAHALASGGVTTLAAEVAALVDLAPSIDSSTTGALA